MSRLSYTRVFRDKGNLEEMLSLRRKGWTYHSLAFLYGVDHSSIYHECKKFEVEPIKKKVSFSIKSVLSMLEIKVKGPKTYNDYLREAGYKSQEYFLTDTL